MRQICKFCKFTKLNYLFWQIKFTIFIKLTRAGTQQFLLLELSRGQLQLVGPEFESTVPDAGFGQNEQFYTGFSTRFFGFDRPSIGPFRQPSARSIEIDRQPSARTIEIDRQPSTWYFGYQQAQAAWATTSAYGIAPRYLFKLACLNAALTPC